MFEEGLWIPIVKLMRAGERNDDVWKFILSNVRQPDHMAGDLHAQMASGEVGAQRLLCAVRPSRPRRHRGARRRDHRAAPRTRPVPASASSPAGTYRVVGRCSTSPTAAEIEIVCALTVDAETGEITVDYTGIVRRQPVGHQRRQELHPRLHDLHRPLGAEPRDPEQPRQPRADQDDRPGGIDRQRRVAATVHRPTRRRHVPAERAAQGARPGAPRAADGRGFRAPCGRCR